MLRGSALRLRPLLSNSRGYAAAPSASKSMDAAAARARQHSLTGSHNELLKRVLFEHGDRSVPERTETAVAEDTIIAHAWKLHQGQLESQRKQERERKFGAMKGAHDALKLENKSLYGRAIWRDVAPLFPRQMRVATRTPPKVIWDYSWTPPAPVEKS